MTFQQDIGLQSLCQIAGLHQTLVAVGTGTFQTVELFWVRSHDDIFWQLLDPSAVVSEDIDGIGIGYDGTLRAA